MGESKKDTDDAKEARTAQSKYRHKKGHMTNVFLTNSDKEVIVDFVKDNGEL